MPDFVEGKLALFAVEVEACIFGADIGDTDSHFNLFAFIEIVETEPISDVIARDFPAIISVNLILALVFVPFCLHSVFRGLLFPISPIRRCAAHAKNEIDRKNSLGRVAECAEEFHTFDFGFTHPAHHRSGFVCEAFPKVQEYVPASLWECVSLH